MSKITVSETVSRSIAVDNSKADVQNAMIRCFQLLEERRFKEANVIIEQVLNIDPNNTDANVANFLVHYKLTSAEDIVKNFKSCVTYKNSLFYELTPFNKTKVIPNCRKPTERNRGGQPNHERHILEIPKHIDETVE